MIEKFIIEVHIFETRVKLFLKDFIGSLTINQNLFDESNMQVQLEMII